ncbi:hypothetical protein FN846DRAFT_213302 [Sphaerosporella brunnea]|uniref:Uncharacterized protein n=1 Tax=Sphaerosporella brunnea TaxID=1250544 RepID=A0A5J5EQ57_9PEZI|nr:hypothetical protein FN846DRAFT_213302 [Sphaerosporella brunnea]
MQEARRGERVGSLRRSRRRPMLLLLLLRGRRHHRRHSCYSYVPGRTGTPGKRRGDDAIIHPRMSDASAADMRMRDSFSQARDPPIKLEETPFDFSFVPPEKFQAAVAEEKPRSSRPMRNSPPPPPPPSHRRNGKSPRSRSCPLQTNLFPQRDEEKVQPPPPAPIPKPKVFTFVAEHTSAVQPAGFYAPQPTARAPGESRPSRPTPLLPPSASARVRAPPPSPSLRRRLPRHFRLGPPMMRSTRSVCSHHLPQPRLVARSLPRVPRSPPPRRGSPRAPPSRSSPSLGN